MYRKASTSEPADNSDSEEEEVDMMKVLKDIEYLGSSTMSWKERKAMENRKVVFLGGKPPKRQRLPLSVAKVPMKRQKLREEKKLQEDILLGRFQRKRRATEQHDKRRSEGGVLMASDGVFKKGILNVKHLLGEPSQPSREGTRSLKAIGGGRRKGKGNKKGKKKGKKH
ncbi:unnamed protein product [Spirodela intermedia]|nr:unnamed protein product [Spirodela intermedia]CAA6664840.1 unnamed protein product [Spirodela intermedia]